MLLEPAHKDVGSNPSPAHVCIAVLLTKIKMSQLSHVLHVSGAAKFQVLYNPNLANRHKEPTLSRHLFKRDHYLGTNL